MDSHWGTPGHRKRKRRRVERAPVLCQLHLDPRLKGDVGLLSEDLFSALFSSFANAQDENNEPILCYIAVAPSSPVSAPQTDAIPWAVLPVRRASNERTSKSLPRSSLRFAPSASALQSFARNLQKLSPNKSVSGLQSPFDVAVLDIAPLGLETVAVSLDDAALARLERAHKEFQERQVTGIGSLRNPLTSLDRHTSAMITTLANGADSPWRESVRKALVGSRIIHAGDLVQLPLDSHPITHVPPPPALVEYCEPVQQGLILPTTRIVIVPVAGRALRPTSPIQIKSPTIANGMSEEEDDTSNEQFFSAVEEATSASPARTRKVLTAKSVDASDGETSTDDDTDLSDGEGETIGLSLPSLPMPSSGMMSAFSSATPRADYPFGNGVGGVASPGSVISSFSTMTIRGTQTKGRLFDTRSLLSRIPEDMHHPKPSQDEDEEARVYVDTTSLPKIGCFSGDWVRVEAAPGGALSSLSSLSMSLGGEQESNENRTAKVYAIPGLTPRKPRYAIDRTGHKRFSQAFAHFDKPALEVYMSPLMMTNLGSPSSIRISSLAPPSNRNSMRGMPPKQHRITSSSMPPFASELLLYKIMTPTATERHLQSSLFLSLQKFFESKRRIVKQGDLIGVPIDQDLSRATQQPSASEEDAGQQELFLRSGVDPAGDAASTQVGVAWFKITTVKGDLDRDDFDSGNETPWAGSFSFGLGYTTMSLAGTEQGKLPDAMSSSWPYYLGTKRLPALASREATFKELMGDMPKTHVSQTRRRLRQHISAATSPQALHLSLPPVTILLVSTQRHIGKATVAHEACADLGLHTYSIDPFDAQVEGDVSTSAGKTAANLEKRAEFAMSCGAEYTALLIRHIDAFDDNGVSRALKTILETCRVLIATTTKVEKVPEDVRSMFMQEIEISAPDEKEREGLLNEIVRASGMPVSADVDMAAVAVKTAALVAGDLVDVVDRAIVARSERLESLANSSNKTLADDRLPITLRDVQLAGGDSVRCVTKADFDVAVDAARKNFADAIGAPKIPNVGWDDVGGLTNVKDAVMETIQLPLERPELFAKGMKKRSGILFYGPPGTGKTLLAKAIATEFSLNFFSVKGPELLNMYIGESEANVRRVFQRARDARPCVVFFDELDSVAPKRGNQGDSGGVMDRIVSQLLAELDGMSNGDDGGGGVFVIGATNRPDLLDQALLRPGRFDKMLYLGVSDTHQKQLTILEALTRKFAMHSSLQLSRVAEQLPFTYTGADLYALCSDAMLKAITRRATAVDAKVRAVNAKRAAPITTAHFFDHLAVPEDTEVVVDEADFLAAMRELVPSVSFEELQHYERVRRVFEMVDDAEKKPNGDAAGARAREENELLAKTGLLSLNERRAPETNGHPAAKGRGRVKTVADGGSHTGGGLDGGRTRPVAGEDGRVGDGHGGGGRFGEATLGDDEELYSL